MLLSLSVRVDDQRRVSFASHSAPFAIDSASDPLVFFSSLVVHLERIAPSLSPRSLVVLFVSFPSLEDRSLASFWFALVPFVFLELSPFSHCSKEEAKRKRKR